MWNRREFLRAGLCAGAAMALAGCRMGRDAEEGEDAMEKLITTLGPLEVSAVGMILPHEHVFVDLRTPDVPGQGEADAQDVVALMAPELEKARAAGVTAIVECSPEGVGRNAAILKAVSEAAAYPLVAPTGIYREPWVPRWAQEASEDALHEWMLGELQGEIEGSGVQAAWIKLSAGDDGITEIERKILRAAARAGAETGAILGSHTRRGRVLHEQLDIVEAAGYTPERFIWIHAQNDTLALNLEVGARGAWIEYDAIGGGREDAFWIGRIQAMLEAGHGEQVMLSHDRGWYDPAKPGGGTPKAFTYISEQFLPKLAAAGVDEATIEMLTATNPFRAFAR